MLHQRNDLFCGESAQGTPQQVVLLAVMAGGVSLGELRAEVAAVATAPNMSKCTVNTATHVHRNR